MRYGQNCKGGKCRSGKSRSRHRGGKCRSKSYGTPTRDYSEKTSTTAVRYHMPMRKLTQYRFDVHTRSLLMSTVHRVAASPITLQTRLVRTAQTAQTLSPYIQGCVVGVPQTAQSPGSCQVSESDSESASKSRTPTPGTRPVSSVVLDTNGRPVDRLLIKNVENFYFLFDGIPYVIAPVFSTPAFSIRAIYSCIFHSCIFYSRIFSAPTTCATAI